MSRRKTVTKSEQGLIKALTEITEEEQRERIRKQVEKHYPECCCPIIKKKEIK